MLYKSDYSYNLGLVYRIQRMRSKGGYWRISFGPGIFRDDLDTDFGLIMDAKIGWVIGGRKKN